MNKKSLTLSISEMRCHIFQRVEDLAEVKDMANAHAVAQEWILKDEGGNSFNPDKDKDYVWLYETRHKRITNKKYRKFTDLDF